MNKQEALNAEMRLTQGRQLSRTQSMRLAESVSQMTAQDISSKYGVGTDKANQISQDARMLNSYYKGEAFHDQTQTSGNLSLSGNAGVNGGKSAKVDGDDGKSKLISFSAGGQIGGSLSGGVSASNADNTGSTKQFNSSEDIAEIQRRFESNMKEVSNSSRNDAVTQLARDHVKTLQENESLSKAQAYHESQARSHLDSYNKTRTLSYAERMNLRDSALQVAREKGFSTLEASRMIDREDPQSKQWIDTARSRLTARPTQMIKQPSIEEWYSTKSQIKSSFNKSEQAMKQDIVKDSAKIDADIEDLNDRRNVSSEAITNAINDSEKAVKSKEEQIRNSSDSLKKDVAERADKGSGSAAWDKFKKTWGFK